MELLDLLLYAISFLSMLPLVGFVSGDGTSGDPFVIGTPAHLDDVRNDIGATGDLTHYQLGAKIDMSGFGNFTKIAGEAFVNFDFNGFNISDITISSAASDTGLFEHTSEECVFTDVWFIDPTVTGEGNTGVLAGDGGGTVNSVSITGATINDSAGGLNFGVLFGRYKGTLNNTKVQGTINTFDGGSRYGGAIGQLLTFTSTVTKAFAVVNIIENGTVTDVGGFIGITGASGRTIEDCFWDTTVGPATDGSNSTATGKTTAEMQNVATFTDTATAGLTNPYDFVGNPNDDVANDDIWDIDGGYPFLSFEVDPTGATIVQPVTITINSSS